MGCQELCFQNTGPKDCQCVVAAMRAVFLLGRNLAICLPHLGGEAAAEQSQGAPPRGGGAFPTMSCHARRDSQDRWSEVERNVGPGGLCFCEEGGLSWSESTGGLSQSFRNLKVNWHLRPLLT